MRYDAVGNLIKDTWTGGGERGYDAENKMTWVVGQNGLMNYYIYDASGHRVRRKLNNNAEEWWQVYGIDGELVAEYKWLGTSAQFQKEYGYRNGQLLIAWDSGETGDKQLQWFVQDHLGSTRIQVGSSGSITSTTRHDYLPFGEELFAGVGNRATTQGYTTAPNVSPRQKFTGQERDGETGLDYFGARYYSSNMGRWASPDFSDTPQPIPHADLTNPQSLNLYAYVYNNPLLTADSDGHSPDTPEWLQRLLNAAAGRGYKTDAELEAERREAEARLAREAYQAYEALRQMGFDPKGLNELSREQLIEFYKHRVDITTALENGATEIQLSDGKKIKIEVYWTGGTQTPNPRLAMKADDLISGSLKKSPSYHSELGQKTYQEIIDLAKQKGAAGKPAKDMKKLIEQGDRLRGKGRKK